MSKKRTRKADQSLDPTHDIRERLPRDSHCITFVGSDEQYIYDREAGVYRPVAKPNEIPVPKRSQRSTEQSENVAYKLRKWLLENGQFITFTDSNELYIYDPRAGIYRPGAEPIVRQKLDWHLGRSSNPGLITKVVSMLKDHTYIARRNVLESSSGLLVVLNGVLNLDTLELLPHTSQRYCLSQIPVSYDPEADCPEFKRWVKTTLAPEYHRVLQQWFGNMITPGHPYKKALFSVGPPNSGKTVLTHIMIAFIGVENTRMKTIRSICARFGSFDLFGAMVNVCDEQPDDIEGCLEEFKKLTGSGFLEGEIKGVQGKVKFVSQAKLCFTGNDFPLVTADDAAFFGRLIILPFERQFLPGEPGTTPRRKLQERLTTPEELSGILNYAVLGCLDLNAEGRFDYSDDPDEIRRLCQSYMRDAVAKFVREKLEFDEEARTEKSVLFASFKDFCDANRMIDSKLDFDGFFRQLWRFFKQANTEVRCNVDGTRLRLLRIRVSE